MLAHISSYLATLSFYDDPDYEYLRRCLETIPSSPEGQPQLLPQFMPEGPLGSLHGGLPMHAAAAEPMYPSQYGQTPVLPVVLPAPGPPLYPAGQSGSPLLAGGMPMPKAPEWAQPAAVPAPEVNGWGAGHATAGNGVTSVSPCVIFLLCLQFVPGSIVLSRSG